MNSGPFPFDSLTIGIDRSEVDLNESARASELLRSFVTSPESARAHQERVEFAFRGYDEDTRELWEIPEVRRFLADLDEEFPYWLFFLRQGPSLTCLLLCFLPPFLTDEAKARILPERANDLLERRWGPAAEQVARFAGLTDAEIGALIGRVSAFLNRSAGA